MDGTLVDSEHHWFTGMIALADEYGATWTHEDGLTCVGLALLDSAEKMRAKGLDLPATEIVDRMVDYVSAQLAVHTEWLPGAREMLTALAEAGVPCALVTMSYRKIAETVVAGAPAGAFRVVVSGDDVSRGKPHPEPYLTAAAALGVPATSCVAVEDSLTGITSAEAAGAHGIVVKGLSAVPDAPGRSTTARLDLLTLDHLAQVAAGNTIIVD